MNPTPPNSRNTVTDSKLNAGRDIHIGDKVTVEERQLVVPPHLTNNIPSNADHILGRDTELQIITSHLAQNKPTVLVNGIGGIGKTSVATKYVATYGHSYKHLAWLTVQSSVAEAFTNDLVLLKSLHIEQDVRQLIETQRLTDAFKLVVKKLNDLESTLVVLDNANNPDDLIAHKNLFDTAKCHYLITSRTQPQEWTIVEIDHLPPDEAVKLFQNLAPSVSASEEDLKSLLEKLFYHTLLIELVAKAVENAGFSFVELQTMIETKFIHDAQLNEDIVSTGKHGDSVADNAKRAKIEEYIWLIFNNVKDLGDDAKQILRGMALLPVATPFDREFLKTHLALFEVKEIVPNLSLLVERGWLEKEGNKWFKMHPLIADVVVEHLEVDVVFAEKFIEQVENLIFYDSHNPEHNLFIKNESKSLAERLKNLFYNENDEGISFLIDRLGYLEENFGSYNKAIEYYSRGLEIAQKLFDNHNGIIAERQNNLANVYNFLGNYERAKELLEVALESDLKFFDEDDLTIIKRRSNLALVYQNIGNYQEAANLLEKALNSALKNFDMESPYVATCQSNLANVYNDLENFERAAELLETALRSALKNFDNQHPVVATREANLGDVYRKLGKYERAAELLESALSSDIKKFGLEHPNIAFRQNNLAWVYNNTGREEEAQALWQAAYINFFKNLGAEHPHTIQMKERAESRNVVPKLKNIISNSSIHAGGNLHIGDVTYINNYFSAQEVKIPHRLTNNIPTNADHILGRATELAQAKEYLEQHQAAVLFNGIGGIGKTALASKYMVVYGSEYKHLAWITVQSTLAEAFTNNAPLLASLQITQQVQDYIAAKQLDKAFEYLFHQLNLLERTLVVIDNANDLDDLDQYKNWFDTANCHFLITSRSQPSEWAIVEVDSLPEDEAVRLFRKLHPSVSADDEAIKSLLSKLFYHTLLIELVAKAGATTGIPFADLQNMIETQFIHHQSLSEIPVSTGKHGSVVPTNPKKAKIEDYIWLVFSQVKGLDEDSKHLLKAMALLPVATPFDLDFLKGHFAFFNIPDAVIHLDALIERGWLQKEQAEGQKPYFKMHPLIGDVVVEHLGVDITFADDFIKHIVVLVTYERTNPNDNLFAKRQHEPMAERLISLFFNGETESISELLYRLNWYNQQFGFYEKAMLYGERALRIAENFPNLKDGAVPQIQSTLSLVYRQLGYYEKSATLLEHVLKNAVSTLGEDHPYVTVYQSNLALVYQDLKRYSEGAILIEKALNTSKNSDSKYDLVSTHQSNLSQLYCNLGRYDEAVSLAKQALEDAEKKFNKDHPTIAVRQSNLGVIYFKMGLSNESLFYSEQALANGEKNFGLEHPNVAFYQFNLANVYNDLGRITEAQALWLQSYKTRLKILGEQNPYTIETKKLIIA